MTKFEEVRTSEIDKNGKTLGVAKLADILRKLIDDPKIKMDRQVIYRIESGTMPCKKALKAYCKYFNVTSDYLLGLSNLKSAKEDYMVTHKLTGLTDNAINCLKSNNLDTSGRSHTLSIINFLLEHEDTTILLEHIYLYLFGNFSKVNNDDSSLIELSDASGLGVNGVALDLKDIDKVFLSMIIDDLPLIKKKYVTDNPSADNYGKKIRTKKELIKEIIFFESMLSKDTTSENELDKHINIELNQRRELLKDLYGINDTCSKGSED